MDTKDFLRGNLYLEDMIVEYCTGNKWTTFQHINSWEVC